MSEMKMVMINGVPTRSFWIDEGDSRLEAGAIIARHIADADGEMIRAVDIDPMADDADILRIHAWGKKRSYIISATVSGGDGEEEVEAEIKKVHEFPEYLIADDD